MYRSCGKSGRVEEPWHWMDKLSAPTTALGNWFGQALKSILHSRQLPVYLATMHH